MENKVVTEYNKKDIYTEKLSCLVDEIHRICRIEKIPYFVTFAIQNQNGETVYKSNGTTPCSLDMSLHDNHINKHFLILQGEKNFHVTEEPNGSIRVTPAQTGDWDEDISSSLNDLFSSTILGENIGNLSSNGISSENREE